MLPIYYLSGILRNGVFVCRLSRAHISETKPDRAIVTIKNQ